ncbi:hypothetical protein ACFVTP_13110 [Streptomyces celluloflavus]|uniref:hypothetical protein n=1 Tax=Streptomyces celluloflavus TaxID=58344 RepID=UPI0036D79EFD
MSDTSALIVPVQVDALVVNKNVRQRDNKGFRRWRPNFRLLAQHLSPEPEPFTNEIDWCDPNDDAAYTKYDGVYLRWEVPEGLRHGRPRTQGSKSEFPLVPNRWLVVRHVKGNNNEVTGWVVESDYLDPDKGTSAAIHPVRASVPAPSKTPYRTGIVPTRMGQRLCVGPGGEAWSEPQGPERKEMFLSAVGPGLMTFHAFQPYHQDVFSLHDDLTGLDTASVSYQVTGWYSDPSHEELTRLLTTRSVEDALADLDWTTGTPPEGWKPASTLYCGRTTKVAWDRTGKAPDSLRPDPDKNPVTVAFGSGESEATAALHAAGRTSRDQPQNSLVLHALACGLSDTLDTADGDILTAQAMHRSWFEQRHGGYIWRLADTGERGNTARTGLVTWSGATADPHNTSDVTDAEKAEQLLAELNTHQTACDDAGRELSALQSRLYALWWMKGLTKLPSDDYRTDLTNETDQGHSGSLAAEVAARQKTLKDKLLPLIPQGEDETELQASIDDYTKKHQFPARYTLRREAMPPFWAANDPTVVLKDANSKNALRSLDGDGILTCRIASQETWRISAGADFPPPFDKLKKGGLPALVSSLLGEFADLLENPGTSPLLPAWHQPWKPLLYQWQITHWPVPYGDPKNPNWTFDGGHYQWTRGDAEASRSVSGRRFLVPLPPYILSKQLKQYATDHPVAHPQDFTKAIEEAADLDLLSQRTDGLTDTFACRDAAPNVSPTSEISDLIAEEFQYLPAPGPLPDGSKWQDSGFTQLRAGQIAMARLSIIDEFGQTLDYLLIGDAHYLAPVRADSLTPGTRLADDKLTDRLVQLPPRLLQPARLRFDFIDAHKDNQLADLTAKTSPVCAWIIPNYVDRSLLCYAPTGEALGEACLRNTPGTDTDTEIVSWRPLPDSTTHTVEDLKTPYPHLHGFITGLAETGSKAFTALLSTTDLALAGISTYNPYGDDVLGTLLGRPLALIRARLRFELEGPPLADPGWQYALNWNDDLIDWPKHIENPGPQMAHLNYRWPLRLGNPGQLGDGLIGYFTEADYKHFYAVTKPGTDDPEKYIAPIDDTTWPHLRANSTDALHLTLLADPQAPVHTTTDILPVTELCLPSRFTRTAMAALRIALRLSPVLTTTRPIPTPDHQSGAHRARSTRRSRTSPATALTEALALPHPTTPQGTWDWAELIATTTSNDPTWQQHPVTPADQSARMDEDGPTIRTGYLRLTEGFGT